MALAGRYGTIEIPGISEDEPVFIIRAKDKASVEAVSRYADAASDYGSSQEYRMSVFERADEFLVWQKQNAGIVKVPD